jgi:hypothetical protein
LGPSGVDQVPLERGLEEIGSARRLSNAALVDGDVPLGDIPIASPLLDSKDKGRGCAEDGAVGSDRLPSLGRLLAKAEDADAFLDPGGKTGPGAVKFPAIRDSVVVVGGGPMSSNGGPAADVNISTRPRSPGRPIRRAIDALVFLPIDCDEDEYPDVLEGRG